MAGASDIRLPDCMKVKYNVEEELARGKYGVVFRSTVAKTHAPVAIKVMSKRGNKRDDVLREVAVLKKLKHPAILSITDFEEYDKEYVLVTELLNGGELFDYVIEKDYLDEAEATFYMKQILDGLSFCHKRSIVHLDLKPENIVLKDKDAKQLVIIDFGTAQDLSANPKAKAMVGTPEFIAPEVLNYEPVNCAADMWAIGIITYVLLTGMSPFLGDSDMETINNIASGEYEYPDPEEDEGYEDISQAAKEFIDNLLHLKAEERATAEDCLKHHWMTSRIGQGARISTVRLKNFRARRKWMAVCRAVRVSISLMSKINSLKRSSTESSSDTCPISPNGRTNGHIDEDALEKCKIK